MKILMWYTKKFAYNPTIRTLTDFEEHSEGKTFENVLLAFIQAEEHDSESPKSVEDKLLKNLKWAAKKNDTRKIVLHSFAHLSESKANPHFTKEIFDKVETRLLNADYEVAQTPFGYFLDISLDAPGYSMARVFKSF